MVVLGVPCQLFSFNKGGNFYFLLVNIFGFYLPIFFLNPSLSVTMWVESIPNFTHSCHHRERRGQKLLPLIWMYLHYLLTFLLQLWSLVLRRLLVRAGGWRGPLVVVRYDNALGSGHWESLWLRSCFFVSFHLFVNEGYKLLEMTPIYYGYQFWHYKN